jgi:hypothetical protein
MPRGNGPTANKLTLVTRNCRQELNSAISNWIYDLNRVWHRWHQFLLLSPN